MPNHRDPSLTPQDIETANPWSSDRWADAEPQEQRGAAGNRGAGDPARERERHEPSEWTGVRPLPPLLPSMPRLKPGDQGG